MTFRLEWVVIANDPSCFDGSGIFPQSTFEPRPGGIARGV